MEGDGGKVRISSFSLPSFLLGYSSLPLFFNCKLLSRWMTPVLVAAAGPGATFHLAPHPPQHGATLPSDATTHSSTHHSTSHELKGPERLEPDGQQADSKADEMARVGGKADTARRRDGIRKITVSEERQMNGQRRTGTTEEM
ncbi:hypothetical protein E2C01_041263 [Portunus trituberculatus]|uniref:Uncharacterized protein n=1 Tax=Portunus trituberculatus TaxID=210409 RepID=A0A5B7FT31_PORTR|nr:hypothetical protein [Portunus trituberculatus]